MGGGKRPRYIARPCKLCGREIQSLGIARHMAMHKDKSEEKQKQLEVDYALYKSNDAKDKQIEQVNK